MRHFALIITSILVAALSALVPRTSFAEPVSQSAHALPRLPVEANAGTCAKSLPTIKAAMALTRPRTSNEQQWIHFAYDCLDKGEMVGVKWQVDGHFSFSARDLVWNPLSPPPVPDNVNEGTCLFADTAFYKDLIPLNRTRTHVELQWVRFYYNCLSYFSHNSEYARSGSVRAWSHEPLPRRGEAILPPVPDDADSYECELAAQIISTIGYQDDPRHSEEQWFRFYTNRCDGSLADARMRGLPITIGK